MIYLCHGLAKSASSFAFFIAEGLADSGGRPQAGLYARYLPERLIAYRPQPYFVQLVDGDLRALVDRLPEAELLVLKLHGPLHPDIAQLLEAGRCRGLCTYRDPRDAAVSLYDAARRERRIAPGLKRNGFTGIETMEQCIEIIGDRLDEAQPWLRNPGILPVSFEALRQDPYHVAGRIRDHMGVQADPVRVLIRYLADKRRIREFNIGRSGRYRTVLTARQESRADQRFGRFLDAWCQR